jgi:translation initiation factor IF-3
LSRPFSRHQPQQPLHRVNGRIRAREVRVIGPDGQQVGVLELPAALNLARAQGVDLVEVAPTAVPPVCRLVDYGKFKYELAKKERDSKKHQHINLVKEVQLSARIDPHDFGIKLDHAIGFLCEDMKVKISLRFRGREMAHTEIGRQVVEKFLDDLGPWGHPDSPAKLIGRSINVMVSPHPKHKRAKNPKEGQELAPDPGTPHDPEDDEKPSANASSKSGGKGGGKSGGGRVATDAAERPEGLENNPFAGLPTPPTPPTPDPAAPSA